MQLCVFVLHMLFQSSSEFKFKHHKFIIPNRNDFQSSSEFKIWSVRVSGAVVNFPFNPLLSLSSCS